MIIKKAEINWMKGFGNFPELKVTVDRMPRMDSLMFKTYINERATTYWASEDDFVTFFTHVPSNESGYGGHMFTGKLEDGSIFKVKGPWSDNAMNVNAFFPSSTSVTYYQEEDDFPEMGFAAHIRMEKAIELIQQCGGNHTFIKQYGGPRGEQEVMDPIKLVELSEKCLKNEIIGNYDIAIRMNGMSLEESQKAKNEK